MMWFKREPKPVSEKSVEKSEKENGKVRKKSSLLKPTRESSERETSAESDKERRRYSDIIDMKVSLGMYLVFSSRSNNFEVHCHFTSLKNYNIFLSIYQNICIYCKQQLRLMSFNK